MTILLLKVLRYVEMGEQTNLSISPSGQGANQAMGGRPN